MQRDKQGNDVPAEPDSMEHADAANGESPTDDDRESNRTGERQAERNRDEEPPA
jgi:hypothetical protein